MSASKRIRLNDSPTDSDTNNSDANVVASVKKPAANVMDKVLLRKDYLLSICAFFNITDVFKHFPLISTFYDQFLNDCQQRHFIICSLNNHFDCHMHNMSNILNTLDISLYATENDNDTIATSNDTNDNSNECQPGKQSISKQIGLLLYN